LHVWKYINQVVFTAGYETYINERWKLLTFSDNKHEKVILEWQVTVLVIKLVNMPFLGSVNVSEIIEIKTETSKFILVNRYLASWV
jgi:hypothetical protein